MKINVRLVYLYLFSFVGLLVVVVGSVRLADLGIKTFIFIDADKYELYVQPKIEGESQISKEEQEKRQELEQKRNKQRELSGSLSMILVGLPLYLYHWKTIQRESFSQTV